MSVYFLDPDIPGSYRCDCWWEEKGCKEDSEFFIEWLGQFRRGFCAKHYKQYVARNSPAKFLTCNKYEMKMRMALK